MSGAARRRGKQPADRGLRSVSEPTGDAQYDASGGLPPMPEESEEYDDAMEGEGTAGVRLRPGTGPLPILTPEETNSASPVRPPLPSYRTTHRPVPPEPYDCEEKGPKLEIWIPSMVSYFRDADLPPERWGKAGCNRLTGKALTWRSVRTRHNVDILDDWKDLTKGLKDRFYDQNRRRMMMDQFTSLKQGNDAVQDYNEKFYLSYAEVEEEITADYAITRYTYGLKPRIKGDVRPRDPATVDEAMSMALQAEQLGKEIRNDLRESYGRTGYSSNRNRREGTPNQGGSQQTQVKTEELNSM